jgi:hypothetical protein
MPDKHDMPAGSTLQLITYDDGIDTEEKWSQSWEGKDHDVGISLIHLSTTKDDDGPPLHFHPYPETIMVRAATRPSSSASRSSRATPARRSSSRRTRLPPFHPRTRAL